MSTRINQHGLRYDDCRHAGIQIARQVSTILKKAGFPKAEPYHPFDHREPGYQCSESGNGTFAKPTAVVMWCNDPHGRDHKLLPLLDAIEADGRFDVDRKWGRITRKTQGTELRELYSGHLFSLHGDAWVILSTNHPVKDRGRWVEPKVRVSRLKDLQERILAKTTVVQPLKALKTAEIDIKEALEMME